jgi:hypothetical protein
MIDEVPSRAPEIHGQERRAAFARFLESDAPALR